jgi:hypothetical protein
VPNMLSGARPTMLPPLRHTRAAAAAAAAARRAGLSAPGPARLQGAGGESGPRRSPRGRSSSRQG